MIRGILDNDFRRDPLRVGLVVATSLIAALVLLGVGRHL